MSLSSSALLRSRGILPLKGVVVMCSSPNAVETVPWQGSCVGGTVGVCAAVMMSVPRSSTTVWLLLWNVRPLLPRVAAMSAVWLLLKPYGESISCSSVCGDASAYSCLMSMVLPCITLVVLSSMARR